MVPIAVVLRVPYDAVVRSDADEVKPARSARSEGCLSAVMGCISSVIEVTLDILTEVALGNTATVVPDIVLKQ